MKLPSFLGPKKHATSATVTAAIAEHDASLVVAHATLDKLEADRHSALLYSDDAALDAVDVKAREARFAVDRLQARRAALMDQLDEVGKREAVEALMARRSAAQAAADAARRWRSERYPALARELVAGLEKILAAEAEIVAVNSALFDAAIEAQPIDAVEPPQESGQFGTLGPAPLIARLTRLVEIPGVSPGYGRITEQEEWAASVGL